jgi:hypothetical protein
MCSSKFIIGGRRCSICKWEGSIDSLLVAHTVSSQYPYSSDMLENGIRVEEEIPPLEFHQLGIKYHVAPDSRKRSILHLQIYLYTADIELIFYPSSCRYLKLFKTDNRHDKHKNINLHIEWAVHLDETVSI